MRIDQAYTHLNIIRDYIPEGNSNRPGTKLSPSMITIHNTDNDQPGANAAAHAKYQKGADARARQVSWHFTVDDGPVYQSLPTNEVGWHAGSHTGNASSIGIEICMNPGLDTQVAYDSAALLTAVLAYQNRIAVPKGIVQHHYWTGKNCPRVLRERAGGWEAFLIEVIQYARDLKDIAAPDLVVADDHHEHGGSNASEGGLASNDQVVIASGGLRLRSGPGTEFDVTSSLPFGASVAVLSRIGDWAQVDTTRDGGADGFVHASFLRPG
ncbi:N-acetylmuramoyl-L-alanine amidase [Rhizobium leguminosarum bv. trifolii WSM597]|uniref:N-acetylmuramoyl-L-alanine amidase n=1 Tax=Rhizobium leguminosarum bv. trifolii WSM597 TaxID=754764 RepID=I9N1J2_RHILT|nr:N-acetylmuramoyl-L-alanine amidase [Rhizobium leguminosarum]EJB01764.1 N-acetylmuramoyl-L-alanine amidase [Rhizobium leguminosarum bv. trifolii WSM597]